MKELLERLRGATGADRALDAAIACQFIFRDLRPASPTDFDGKFGYSSGDLKCEHGFLQADRYTASLDAALSLVERVLPGWRLYGLSDQRHFTVAAYRGWGVGLDEKYGPGAEYAYAPTAPLALLTAMLIVLSGRPEAEDVAEDQSNGTNNNPSLSKPNQ